jgi:hypothetical protein
VKFTVSREHANRFAISDTFTIVFPVRWYVRLWRWTTRHKPPVWEATSVSSGDGAIRFGEVVYDAEEGKR